MVGHITARHHRAGCGADQRRLDGQAAQPRLPGHPAGVPGTEIRPGLVHAADTAPDRADYARDVLGYARGSTDYRDVLADPEVDIVSICAPNLLHREIGIAAAKAGKPFWIEKPVGRDAVDTAAVAAAAPEAGVATSIGYNYRHAPAVERIRESDRERRAGPDHQRPRGVLQRLRLRTQRGAVVAVQEGPRRQRRARRPAQPRRGPVQYVVGPITDVNALLSTVSPAAPDPADGPGHPLRGDRERRAR